MGGAIFNDGGEVTITNSTLTGNTAAGGIGGSGGGTIGSGHSSAAPCLVYNGTLTATFDTFTSNTVSTKASDVFVLSDGSGKQATASIINSILGQNTARTTDDFDAYTRPTAARQPNLSGSNNDLVTQQP